MCSSSHYWQLLPMQPPSAASREITQHASCPTNGKQQGEQQLERWRTTHNGQRSNPLRHVLKGFERPPPPAPLPSPPPAGWLHQGQLAALAVVYNRSHSRLRSEGQDLLWGKVGGGVGGAGEGEECRLEHPRVAQRGEGKMGPRCEGKVGLRKRQLVVTASQSNRVTELRGYRVTGLWSDGETELPCYRVTQSCRATELLRRRLADGTLFAGGLGSMHW